MEVINSRSPFFITIDAASQTATKIELFIWHKGETEPVDATYTLTKNAPSDTQRANIYNIAQFIKENLDIISPLNTTVIAEEVATNWCYCKAKLYATISDVDTFLDEYVFIGVNGYNDYLNGYNQTNNSNVFLLTDNIEKQYHLTPTYKDNSYFNLLIQEKTPTETISIKYFDSTNTLISNSLYTTDEDYLLRVRYSINDTDFDNGTKVIITNDTTSTFLYKVTADPVCEPKYNPMIVSFINRLGGWDFITFFKAKSESYETKSKDFNLLPDAVDYNPLRGQKQKFNFESKKSIKINSGWVAESFSILMEQLFNSETILLDNVPVFLKSSNFQIKTHLKDKNINYELDFEYNFNQINNVQ